MLFSSVFFISVFLPAVLLLYYLCPSGKRNYILLLSSYFFYAWGDAEFLWVMFLSILINYTGAIVLSGFSRQPSRKIILILFIVLDLLPLLYFKYFNFTLRNLSACFGFDYRLRNIILPLGISFYTFQGLSYLVDVYRKDVAAQKDPLKLALYITFFPQLIAGPILKYHEVERQIEDRQETVDFFIYGIRRFTLGLGKKVIIANSLGYVADLIFLTPADMIGTSVAWGGAVVYSLQLFYDFSGYSDMAIGLGAMFGFRFPENFNYPYVSLSVSEFWRRWHISLSTWFKEYLYIPLGGNRVSKTRNLVNLLIVFAATGVWHGAEWTFIVWGLFHGFFILFEKVSGFNKAGNAFLSRLLHRLYLLFVVMIAWVIFRSKTLHDSFLFIRNMLFLLKTEPLHQISFYFTKWVLFILAIAILLATGVFRDLNEKTLHFKPDSNMQKLCFVLFNAFCLFVLFLSLVLLAGKSYNPFIYFRF